MTEKHTQSMTIIVTKLTDGHTDHMMTGSTDNTHMTITDANNINGNQSQLHVRTGVVMTAEIFTPMTDSNHKAATINHMVTNTIPNRRTRPQGRSSTEHQLSVIMMTDACRVRRSNAHVMTARIPAAQNRVARNVTATRRSWKRKMRNDTNQRIAKARKRKPQNHRVKSKVKNQKTNLTMMMKLVRVLKELQRRVRKRRRSNHPACRQRSSNLKRKINHQNRKLNQKANRVKLPSVRARHRQNLRKNLQNQKKLKVKNTPKRKIRKIQ